ncbi:MAG: PilN domain-containing protein [Candidatus Krumholzibacteriota bacterium]|nr:PilN domain-containing protein [Candidatus Krumholzibacteriota bacterium]
MPPTERAAAYCLRPREGVLDVLKLSPVAGDLVFRVEWTDAIPLDAEDHPRLKELARSREVTLLLPNDKVLLLETRLPAALKGKELEKAIVGLAHRERGRPAAGWELEWRPRRGQPERSPDGKREIVALLSENDLLRPLRERLAAWDVAPARVLPDALALDGLLRRELSRLPGVEPGAWSVVYLGEDERFLLLGDEHDVLLYRRLPEDRSGGADPEQYQQRLLTEIDRSHMSVRQVRRDAHVGKVHLAGTDPLLAALKRALSGRGGLEVEAWEAERRFTQGGQAAPAKLLLLLAGASLGFETRTLHLKRPPRETVSVRTLRSWTVTAGLALSVIGLPLLAGGALWTRLVQERTLSEQSARIPAAAREARDAALGYLRHRAVLGREAVLDAHGAGAPDLAGMLADLALRTPQGVHLTGLGMERDEHGNHQLQLEGESRGASSATAQNAFLQLQSNLAHSRFLTGGSEPSHLEIRQGQGEETGLSIVRFRLEYRLRRGDAS